jgi:type IV secretion system protein VirB11
MTDEFIDPRRDPYTLLHFMEPFQHLLSRPDLTDLCINRPGEVWAETHTGWEIHKMDFLTLDTCNKLASLVAGYNNKTLDQKQSTMSGRLPKGERIEIILPPSCEADTVSFTMRRPSSTRKSIDQLDGEGRFSKIRAVTGEVHGLTEIEKELMELRDAKRWADFMKLAVQSKQNIIFSGPTGSGKTTFGKSFMDYIPKDERIITIEDVSEITLPNQPNHVHLFYDKDGQGSSVVTAKRLLQSALRMKPSRILMAELRSSEAYDFFDGVNTGHPGSMTTVHANTPIQAFDRLAKLVSQSDNARGMLYSDIKSSLIQSIDVIVQCAQERNEDGLEERNITAIYYDPEFKRKQGV